MYGESYLSKMVKLSSAEFEKNIFKSLFLILLIGDGVLSIIFYFTQSLHFYYASFDKFHNQNHSLAIPRWKLIVFSARFH